VADNYLNLADSHIVSLNYLQLKATNEFAGNVGSQISAPYVDLNLRSTNGFLAVSNLLAPTIARPEGFINLYSARWTNTTVASILLLVFWALKPIIITSFSPMRTSHPQLPRELKTLSSTAPTFSVAPIISSSTT